MCGGRGGGTRNTSTPLTSGKCLSGPSMTPPLHNVPKSSQVSWLPMPVPVQLGSPLYSAPSLPTTPTWGSPAQACGGPRAAKTQQPSCHATQQAWRQWGGGAVAPARARRCGGWAMPPSSPPPSDGAFFLVRPQSSVCLPGDGARLPRGLV